MKKRKDDTREIYYIEEDEDTLAGEVTAAAERTMEENLVEYSRLIGMLLGMAGLNINTYKPDRTIYYIENES